MKRNKLFISISVALTLCVLVLCLCGCGNGNNKTSDKHAYDQSNFFSETSIKNGVHIGFKDFWYYGLAAHSDRNQFDIDNVSLDFYYCFPEVPSGLKCFAVYCGPFSVLKQCYSTVVQDYSEIEGAYLLDTITPQEAEKGPYNIEMIYSTTAEETPVFFHFKKTRTIPKEMFEKDKGNVTVHLLQVYEEEGGDRLEIAGGWTLGYEKTDVGNIRLSKQYTMEQLDNESTAPELPEQPEQSEEEELQ